MTLSLAQFESRVDALLQADAGLVNAPDIETGIRRALETYSDDVPRVLVADDATADGTIFDFDLPAGFIFGWARLLSVESPAGERIPVYLSDERWSIYRTASTTKIRFLDATPASGKTIRFTYTAAHTIDDLDEATATTIPSYHDEIFAKLCAAEALEMYATRYLHERENTLGADAVDRDQKTDEARRLANNWRSQYEAEVGKRRGVTPGFGRVDWDTSFARSGVPMLTHGRRGW